MITLKTKNEILKMKKAGELLALCHKEIRKLICPGISTLEIDRFAEDFIIKNGATPEQKGYSGYPSWSCLLYTSPSPRDGLLSRMPSSA